MKKVYDATWDSIKTYPVPGWYNDCKLGIFIHWGLYSVPAYAPETYELGEVPIDEEWFTNNPYAEWYSNSVKVGRGPSYEYHVKKYGKDFEYSKFAEMWKAEKWNPKEWAKLFKDAGAKYVVLTTKHHDGFCLFPSKYTDYNSVVEGPKRDLVGELTDAVREEDMKMGLYYSGIIDWSFWHEPIFVNPETKSKACPTFEYADYAFKQSIELIDKYKPSVFWNDIGWPYAGENQIPHLLSHYYNTVDGAVTNDRWNDLYYGFKTKEYQNGDVDNEEKWEMCRGLGLSFGYNEAESDERVISVAGLVNLLVSTVANNGNLLINVGPKANGEIPERQVERLLGLGNWMKVNGEAIYDTTLSRHENVKLDNSVEVYFTAKNDDTYLFLDKLSEGNISVLIPKLKGNPKALDASLNYTFEETKEGLKIEIKNYNAESCALAFYLEDGEL